ncbi:glycoside hydrolase family 2 protein [Pedobacter immunditicola]|uniref:glycoside hydrolase family 2 protein n=1 Tax=Pedobacter immunditicola TaxID=3133440 RepID=UPI0030969F23
MYKKYYFFLLLFLPYFLFAQLAWKPVEGTILTPWATKVSPEKPHPEYPRPQLVRTDNWQNLNGLWQYQLTAKEKVDIPTKFEGQLLVPFAIESSLSGVGKRVGKDQLLWYKKTLEISKKLLNKRLLLHFGAVDWECTVFVNGKNIGMHKGGFDPFSFDITPYLKKGNKQEIAVRVFDPTDDGPQPVGKQTKNPQGIWYTPVTGIWQTVWLEAVPQSYISAIKATPDIDQQVLNVNVDLDQRRLGDRIRVSAWDGLKLIAETYQDVESAISLSIKDPKLWSPKNPFLYDLKVSVWRKGKVVDEVTSYFAMRKISMKKDANGIQRMMLNNEFVFQYGTLDQGWWPDGLYTAPTDEALAFDVVKTKEMGFNMIRKHIKVESARWYYHCDQLGMLVWQDMPSGDIYPFYWDQKPGQVSGKPLDKERSALSEESYRTEWNNIMSALHHFPSIVMWVPFNEAWGQFKTMEVTKLTLDRDPSRLVNSASGGNYFPVGHVADLHNYPDPMMPAPMVFGDKQVLVLGEFGGLGLPLEGHTWLDKGNWGYQSFKSKADLLVRYEQLMKDLKPLIPLGLSAAVYTQITDVEIETNGLITYDRKEVKIPEKTLYDLHIQLYKQ